MVPHRPDLRGYIYLSLMVLFGSTTSPFAMLAVRELPVGILPLLRFSFATLCLIPFLSDRGALWRLLREDTPPAGPGRRLLRADQPELFPQRGPARAQLARGPFLRRLPAGRLDLGVAARA